MKGKVDVKVRDHREAAGAKVGGAVKAGAERGAKVGGAVKAGASIKVKAPEVKIKAPTVKVKAKASAGFKIGQLTVSRRCCSAATCHVPAALFCFVHAASQVATRAHRRSCIVRDVDRDGEDRRVVPRARRLGCSPRPTREVIERDGWYKSSRRRRDRRRATRSSCRGSRPNGRRRGRSTRTIAEYRALDFRSSGASVRSPSRQTSASDSGGGLRAMERCAAWRSSRAQWTSTPRTDIAIERVDEGDFLEYSSASCAAGTCRSPIASAWIDDHRARARDGALSLLRRARRR